MKKFVKTPNKAKDRAGGKHVNQALADREEAKLFFMEDVFAHAPLHVQRELSRIIQKRIKNQ